MPQALCVTPLNSQIVDRHHLHCFSGPLSQSLARRRSAPSTDPPRRPSIMASGSRWLLAVGSVVAAGVFVAARAFFLRASSTSSTMPQGYWACENIYHILLAAGAFDFVRVTRPPGRRHFCFCSFDPSFWPQMLLFLFPSNQSSWPPELFVAIGRRCFSFC